MTLDFNRKLITLSVFIVNEEQLKFVDKFSYPGNAVSRTVRIDHQVTIRIAKASVAFGILCAIVRERNGIKLATLLNVYKAVVPQTL